MSAVFAAHMLSLRDKGTESKGLTNQKCDLVCERDTCARAGTAFLRYKAVLKTKILR